jgi:hypothetical protein
MQSDVTPSNKKSDQTHGKSSSASKNITIGGKPVGKKGADQDDSRKGVKFTYSMQVREC